MKKKIIIINERLPLTTEHLQEIYKSFRGKKMKLKDLRKTMTCIFLVYGIFEVQ